MATGTPSEAEIRALLHRLNSAEAGAAWAEFLDLYAQHIMGIAAQIEFEQDRLDECFLHVCEKLCENNFRRLLKFNPAGRATLRTWLGTVVFNLCVDWHRSEYGRARMLPAISALAEFDQAVYRLVLEQQMGKKSAFERLRSDHPDLTRKALDSSLERIHRALTPRQRWRLSLGGRSRPRPATGHDAGQINQLPSSERGPEAQLQACEETELVNRALSRLPPEQRLLLYWRFQEGLSLKNIAKLADLGSTSRAWTEIQRALAALSELTPGIKKLKR